MNSTPQRLHVPLLEAVPPRASVGKFRPAMAGAVMKRVACESGAVAAEHALSVRLLSHCQHREVGRVYAG